MKDKITTQVDDIFSQLADANREWFGNLVAANKGYHKDSIQSNVFVEVYRNFFDNAKLYLETQQKFYKEQVAMWQEFFNQKGEEVKLELSKLPVDRRFSDPNWETNPFFAYLKNSYLTMSNFLVEVVGKSQMDEEVKERTKFFMQQYLDAISPTNFALTNPEVIKSVVETGGMSLADGMKNMVEDVKNGYISMTDEKSFAVGSNLATTKGKIIYKNKLIELIQYATQTDKVYSVPLLIVPPCINKYYILDLQEQNSLVKFLVDCGFSVFLISWRSADKSTSDFRWEEYIELGVIQSVEVIREVTGESKINTLGYCIGGLILTTAYLVMLSRGQDWVNAMAHMATMLDHSEPGDIKFFIDRDLLALKNATKNSGGIMSGKTISQTFSALRANELIWNYWINNYLLGKVPKPFDILYWNSDTVDLPVRMHSFLLEKFYLNDELVKGDLKLFDIVLNLQKISCPMYLFAAQKDHIVPWKSVYKTLNYIRGSNIRFVLGASGHTAGVVNPPGSNKRSYWVNNQIEPTADEWFLHSKELQGSWWNDFNDWLKQCSGKLKKANILLGSQEYQVKYNAPGKYVKVRAMNVVEAELV